MNKDQRKRLNIALKAISPLLEDLRSALDDIGSEEQEKFDNMSEGLQQTETGQKLEQNVTDAEDISSELETAIDQIDELVQRTEELTS